MIFKTNMIGKEFRNAYVQQNFSRQRLMALGVFLGMGTFSIYFVLQTLIRSVLVEAIPQVMMQSFFSTIYIYLNISLVFFIGYFIVNYEYLTFEEVLHNRWYVLVQMGFEATRMILTKIVARLISLLLIYSIGFITTIFLTSFLKFPMVTDYFITLYLVGAMDLLIVSMITLTCSLYIRDTLNARYIVGLLAIALVLFKIVTGFYSIMDDRSSMFQLSNLFDINRSIYMPLVLFIAFGCMVLCVLRGNLMSRVFHSPLLINLPQLTKHNTNTIVLSNNIASKKPKIEAGSALILARSKNNVPSILSSIILSGLIVGMVLVNVVVLACGYASPERETSVFGTIPYVFQSSTMEPEIMFNDIALFHKMDVQAIINVNDVILYKDIAKQVQVARVKEIVNVETLVDNLSGDGPIGNETEKDVTNSSIGSKKGYKVDFDNYPDKKYLGEYAETINREAIYGKLYGTNRWIGALVLFANTMIGRLTMLLVPTFLLFFYSQIVAFFKTLTQEKI